MPGACGVDRGSETSIDAMTTATATPAGSSGYADCLEAIHARLTAREAKLYGIAVIVVYVHQLERLSASAGPVNAGRMVDELRNRLSQVNRPGDYFARLGERKFVFVLSNLRNEGPRAAHRQQDPAHRRRARRRGRAARKLPALDRPRDVPRARALARGAHAVRGGRAPRGLEDAAGDGRLHRPQGAEELVRRLGPRVPARERARARRPRAELPAEAVAAEARGRRCRKR